MPTQWISYGPAPKCYPRDHDRPGMTNGERRKNEYDRQKARRKHDRGTCACRAGRK